MALWKWLPPRLYWINGQFVVPGRTPPASTDSTLRILRLSGASLYDPLIDNPVDPPDPPDPTGTVLLNTDFNTYTYRNSSGTVSTGTWATAAGGAVQPAEWNRIMGMGTGNSGVAGNTSNLAKVSMQSESGSKFLRFRLPLTPAGSSTIDNGVQLWCHLPTVNGTLPDRATFKYRMRYTGDWNPWGWGWKLPGLGGVAPGESVSWPSGGKYGGSRGWSGRLMGIGRDASGASSYTSKLNSLNVDVLGLYYNYGFDQQAKGNADGTSGAYGDNLYFNQNVSNGVDHFTAGVWIDVEIYYQLNTPGQANGIVEVKTNGLTRFRKVTWQPRTRSDVRIGQTWWHFFRGGNTGSWGLPYDTWIDIDNVSITVPA